MIGTLSTKLSLAMVGTEAALSEQSGGRAGPRGVFDRAAAEGFGAVQLNAAMEGLRPRELGQSARRDLAALLRRTELGCSGVDLLIPPSHYVDRERSDRAFAALHEAIGLVGQLASLGCLAAGDRPVLTVTLPGEGAGIAEAAAHAERHGVVIADLAWPVVQRGIEWGYGVAVDTGAVLAAGRDPSQEILALGGAVAGVRLGDVGGGGFRLLPGQGRLDLPGCFAGLAATGFRGVAVVDVRGLRVGEGELRRVCERWAGLAGGF